MKNNIEACWIPPGAQEYRNYLLPNGDMPPLRVEQLDTKILVGGGENWFESGCCW